MIMKKAILGIIIFIALVLLGIKLYYSEQLRIAFNRPKYLYDGRHYLTGDERGARFYLKDQLLLASEKGGTDRWEKGIRIVPGGGIEMIGEDSLNFTTSRKGERRMLKFRPMKKEDADNEKTSPIPESEDGWGLYLERRLYEDDELKGLERDLLIDEKGVRFITRAPIPENMDSPGKEGQTACDGKYFYVYQGGRWFRAKLEEW